MSLEKKDKDMSLSQVSLVDWFPSDKIDFATLCGLRLKDNHLALQYVEQNIDKLKDNHWIILAQNPDAIYILKTNSKKIEYAKIIRLNFA